jgi:hypothetical protein
VKQYGYIGGKRVELDANQAVEIVIDKSDDYNVFNRWGGHTLARILMFENGKRVVGFVSARISGDSRAGSQKGFFLQVTAAGKAKDSSKEVHAVPWLTGAQDY